MDEGVYDKYRVVKVADLERLSERVTNNYTWPADIRSARAILAWIEEHAISSVDEGTSFVFVLRPDRDYHARVALATYAMSVSAYNPALSADLFQALDLMDTPTSLVPD